MADPPPTRDGDRRHAIAGSAAQCTGGRYGWAEVEAPIRAPGGIRDLYVVFDAPGVNLGALSFRPAYPNGSRS